MDFQLKVFQKMEKADEEFVLPQEVEKTLDKLVNIERTSQFDLLNLDDQACENIIQNLDLVKIKLGTNRHCIERVAKMRPEYIPIQFSDESFI